MDLKKPSFVKRSYGFLIIIATCVLLCETIRAVPIGRIELTGQKTKASVIQKLLASKPGDEFKPALWEKDLQRIRNTKLFYDIQSKAVEEDGKIILKLNLRNKFSIIPIFKFKQGGGTSLLTVGVYEVNLFNRYLEGGMQFERLNNKNGFVSWFRHPTFLGRKNQIGTEVYVHTINLPLLTLKGNEEANFDNEEIRWNLRLVREVSDQIRMTMEGSIYKNTLNPDNSTSEKRQRNTLFNAVRPVRSGVTVSAAPSLVFGKINNDRFYVQGHELSLKGEIANKALGSDFDFVRGELGYLGAFRPKETLNLAANFKLGSKSGEEFQHKYYLGGLDSVRGFFHGQFRGEHMFLFNAEARPTLVERELWVLQGNVFTDLSKTWDSTHFRFKDFGNPVWSYGLGFRIILTRIYRAVLRFDIARTHQPVRQFGASFGVQQVF